MSNSFPPGSGFTARHWIQAILCATLAGLSATAQAFPTPTISGVCHVGIAVTGAIMLGLGLTTPSVQQVKDRNQ